MTAADRPGLRRFLLWSPVAIQMALIFYFSHQPSRSPVLDWFPLPFSLGHFLGYALLGALLYRAFAGGLSFSWNAAAAGRSLLISLLYAFSDEFHQLFVPGRDASFLDILLDGPALPLSCCFTGWSSPSGAGDAPAGRDRRSRTPLIWDRLLIILAGYFPTPDRHSWPYTAAISRRLHSYGIVVRA